MRTILIGTLAPLEFPATGGIVRPALGERRVDNVTWRDVERAVRRLPNATRTASWHLSHGSSICSRRGNGERNTRTRCAVSSGRGRRRESVCSTRANWRCCQPLSTGSTTETGAGDSGPRGERIAALAGAVKVATSCNLVDVRVRRPAHDVADRQVDQAGDRVARPGRHRPGTSWPRFYAAQR